MHGEIKLASWRPFRAEQVIRMDRGMIWQATTRLAGLPIRGADWLVDGEGSMRWRLMGLFSVVTASGPDITRSAAGRLKAESIWLPSLLCRDEVAWEAPEPWHLMANFQSAGEAAPLELEIGEGDVLRSVSVSRWGNPEGAKFRYAAFGGLVEKEGTFDGYTIPTRIRVGWYVGSERFASEGEFFRVTIDDAVYR
jgi:hypothetical protein